MKIRPSKAVSREIQDVYKYINELFNSINPGTTRQDSRDYLGKPSDIKIIKVDNNDYRIRFKTEDGWLELIGGSSTVGDYITPNTVGKEAIESTGIFIKKITITDNDFGASKELYQVSNAWLKEIIIKVVTAFDVASTIAIVDDDGTLFPADRNDIMQARTYEEPIMKEYITPKVITANFTGTPSLGELMVVLVFIK